MFRKFLGMTAIMAFAAALIGCGSSSTSSSDDECTKDPESINCKTLDDSATQQVE